MDKKDDFDFDIEKIKREQVNQMKNSIKKVVNENKEYYKDKDYAKYFFKNIQKEHEKHIDE